jgi:hypothetical protein
MATAKLYLSPGQGMQSLANPQPQMDSSSYQK